MTREFLIERILTEVYNGAVPNDASITSNHVNSLMNDGIGEATKQHYGENIKIGNVAYVSNSFYTTIRDISVSAGQEFAYYTATLPQIPIALGGIEIASTRLYNASSGISLPLIQLNVDQINQYIDLPKPVAVPYWHENNTLYFNSPGVILTPYKVSIRMIYAGDATDLTSQINVPDEWIGVIQAYVVQQLILERQQPRVAANDGTDNVQK